MGGGGGGAELWVWDVNNNFRCVLQPRNLKKKKKKKGRMKFFKFKFSPILQLRIKIFSVKKNSYIDFL